MSPFGLRWAKELVDEEIACRSFVHLAGHIADRCGNELVSIGDRMAEVVRKCGLPDAREIRNQDRYFRVIPEGRFIGVLQEVEVEEWTYNLWSNRFLRFLRFENGRLARIETGDYGY